MSTERWRKGISWVLFGPGRSNLYAGKPWTFTSIGKYVHLRASTRSYGNALLLSPNTRAGRHASVTSMAQPHSSTSTVLRSRQGAGGRKRRHVSGHVVSPQVPPWGGYAAPADWIDVRSLTPDLFLDLACFCLWISRAVLRTYCVLCLLLPLFDGGIFASCRPRISDKLTTIRNPRAPGLTDRD